MGREFSELMSEALGLDDHHKRQLADALEDNLERSHSVDSDALKEAIRRKNAVKSGELTTVDGPEALARVRAMLKR